MHPLKINMRNQLIALNLLVVVLIIAIMLFPTDGLRIALGLPFLMFFPGYTLMAALFPKREGMDALERIALSFGMSIAVVPLIGLILNYTPWGVRLEPVLYSVASFIFITSIVAWLRGKRLPEQERFGIEVQLVAGWGRTTWDKVLSVVLVIIILGTLGTLGYVLATPKKGETFTEFYILGPDGKAQDYPAKFFINGDKTVFVRYGDSQMQEAERGNVILGIVNHEHELATYLVRVIIAGEQAKVYFDGNESGEVGPIELDHGEKWEYEIGFAPQDVGNGQKVEFVLYKDRVPYFEEPLHLWIDVKIQD